MKIWDKLDEVIGAGLLTGVACFAMYIGFNGNVVAIAVTGIITLLAASAGGKGGDPAPAVA